MEGESQEVRKETREKREGGKKKKYCNKRIRGRRW